MLNRRRTVEILAQTVREIGILGFVFAPLDALFAEPRVGVAGVTAIVLLAVGMISVGIIVEGGR